MLIVKVINQLDVPIWNVMLQLKIVKKLKDVLLDLNNVTMVPVLEVLMIVKMSPVQLIFHTNALMDSVYKMKHSVILL